MFDGFGGNDAVDVEERLYGAFDLGHAEDISGVDARAEVWRGFDFVGSKRHDFLDAVYDEAHLHVGAGREFDLYDDDTGALGKLSLEAEFDAQVDDGDHAASQVDHALHEFRHLRNRGDLLHANDFTNLQNGDAVGLVVEGYRQVLAGILGVDGGGDRRGDGSTHKDGVARTILARADRFVLRRRVRCALEEKSGWA